LFNNHIKLFSTFLLVLSIASGKDKSKSLKLSNGVEIIEIKPGSMIKLNGKEGQFTGFDVKKNSAGFITLGSYHIKYYVFKEIKKIQLLKGDWVLTNIMSQGKIGFKKGLDISKIISLFSVYFIYDRENNDRVDITSMEKKYISTLMITPVIGAVIGGSMGLISPKLLYELPISLNERTWQILL
tara:strand:+ start:596 stop:1147 length:552 start_codon:yes stop_codon:yes gene_type:complete